jgi:hypothetical protein
MSDHEGSRDREEYADWSPPGTDETRTDTGEGRSVDLEGEPPADGEDEEWDKPSTIREPLFRDWVRERLGVSPRRWYVIETVLLVAPYVVFVFVYLTFDVPEVPFLLLTLLYSLIAIYVGILP